MAAKVRTEENGETPPAWLRVIWKANDIAKERDEELVFGKPTYLGPHGNACFREDYPECDVLIEHRKGGYARFVVRSARAGRIVEEAAAAITSSMEQETA